MHDTVYLLAWTVVGAVVGLGIAAAARRPLVIAFLLGALSGFVISLFAELNFLPLTIGLAVGCLAAFAAGTARKQPM